jgi:hypothetical protein
MATVYKAIINVGEISKVVEAATPAALGTAIGAAIPTEPRNDVEVVYEIRGTLSRRAAD